MLGYVIREHRKKDEVRLREFEIPSDLRRRLAAWVDVEEVGPEGFWVWLRAILPLLPTPPSAEKRQNLMNGPRSENVHELQQRLVVYAREHSRLNVVCEQYVRDNQILSRRLRALEAALRTLAMGKSVVEIPPDAEVAEISNRYIPHRWRK